MIKKLNSFLYYNPFINVYACGGTNVNSGLVEAVNVAASLSSSLLKKMSEETEGEYYYCSTVYSIKPVLGSIQKTTVNTVDPTDTDHGGLYDVYVTMGFPLMNGRIIFRNITFLYIR